MATATLVHLTVIGLLITTAAAAVPATSYANHTVGDVAGWFFNVNTNASATGYSSWAANQTFNLGDYLIFKTNTNQSVIQTYNEAIYKSCIIDDAPDDEYFQYDGGSREFGQALTIAVPLTIEGPNYYFSDADDGVQCQHGMAFEIVVNRGLGLPPSLNQPPPPPYMEPPGPDSAKSPPVTIGGGSTSPSNSGLKSNINPNALICFLLLTPLALSFF
ncbi:cucumber peeling cupredoxin-like [Carica papaya]|uniref:cucumber peeling cupredoxin-like n=1 Tax=Carica papaya TaxID=3649 RepID=UPI000B8CA7CB|nr:cucumber peeling cupredoxin-like [Carica papaya]